MKAEIKNYKRFAGHDGQGFEATLYLDGKRAAVISDDGWGGEWNWGIMPNMLPYIEEFRAKCEALPNMPSEYFEDGIGMDATIWIEENLLGIADAKKYCGGKITFIDDGKIWNMGKYNKNNHDQIIKALAVKYPNARLINGMPVVAII